MTASISQAHTSFGFRTGQKGVHNTGTIMLDDLAVLLNTFPPDTTKEAYREAVVEENALGKRTASTRKYNFQRLAELYALDPEVPVFRLLRRYWDADEGPGRPVVGMLCALARDPILRMTAGPVLALNPGAPFEKEALEQAVAEAAPGRFSPTSLAKIARMTGSSWTQSGHLDGRYNKVRARPEVTPPAVAYALVLGYLAGARGGQTFETFWARALDVPPDRLHDLAQEASRRGLLTYRNAGGIVDVAFDDVLTEDERGRVHEQA